MDQPAAHPHRFLAAYRQVLGWGDADARPLIEVLADATSEQLTELDSALQGAGLGQFLADLPQEAANDVAETDPVNVRVEKRVASLLAAERASDRLAEDDETLATAEVDPHEGREYALRMLRSAGLPTTEWEPGAPEIEAQHAGSDAAVVLRRGLVTLRKALKSPHEVRHPQRMAKIVDALLDRVDQIAPEAGAAQEQDAV
jgi:hypothetical protein